MGAKVIGYSTNHIELDIISIIGDIRDLEKLNQTFETYCLAAQPLVKIQ